MLLIREKTRAMTRGRPWDFRLVLHPLAMILTRHRSTVEICGLIPSDPDDLKASRRGRVQDLCDPGAGRHSGRRPAPAFRRADEERGKTGHAPTGLVFARAFVLKPSEIPDGPARGFLPFRTRLTAASGRRAPPRDLVRRDPHRKIFP